MKSWDFLSKLVRQGKLELVESSEEMSLSYIEKSENCSKSARLLYDNGLFENSVTSSYYAMYNFLVALLFGIGVKCENHMGSIILLEEIFGNKKLYEKILLAKKERIDGQYYVTSKVCKDVAREMLEVSEDFILEMKLLTRGLRNEDIKMYREKFGVMFGGR